MALVTLVGGLTAGFQPEMVPSSVAKMKMACLPGARRKSVGLPLKTTPVGADCVPGANPPTSVTNAILKVDNSDKGSANGAVYKGMTSAEINGHRFLYVTNFRSGKVEVYDTNFQRVRPGEDAFEDEGLPRGFAPFNVQNVGGTLFVTYAKQDALRHDPVGGDC